MKLIKQTTLHYQEGSSDKIYQVDLCQTEPDKYVVNFRYGRRGGTLKEGVKTAQPVALAQAEKVFNQLVGEKTKKGYQDVSPTSTAPTAAPKAVNLADPNARKQAILERLAGKGNSKWPLSRAIWRAGELKISEATPLLVNLIGKHDALTDYCIAWALGWCGGEAAISTLIQLYQKASSPEFVARIAFEALLKVSSPQTKADLQAEMVEFLPQQLQGLAKNGPTEQLATAVRTYLETEERQHFTVLDTLYQIDHAFVRPVLLEILRTAPFKPNYFQRIRHIFKIAEYRHDAEVFAILARRFEQEKSNYRIHYGGVHHRDLGYLRNYDYRYNPATRNHDRILTNQLNDEIASPDSKLAYSDKTRQYLIRRVWRSLKQLGEENDSDYVNIASQILLQYSDADAEAVKCLTRYRWNSSTQRPDYYEQCWDAFAGHLTFNHILYENSPRHVFFHNNLAWRCREGYKPTDPEPEVREEAFPQLWEQHPERLLQLLLESNCKPVHHFAVKAIRTQASFCDRLDLPTLLNLVKRPYEITAKLGFDLIVSGGHYHPTNLDLILAVLNCTSLEARAGAHVWIEQQRDYFFLESTQVITTLITSNYADNRTFARRLLNSSVINNDAAKVLIGRIIAELLSFTSDRAELATEIGEILLTSFAPQLRNLGLGVVFDLLRHPLPEIQRVGGDILFNHEANALDLPSELIESLLASPHEFVRVIGVRLLGQLPDERLMRDRTLIVAMATNESFELRSAIQTTIQRLAIDYPEFSTQLASDLIGVLLLPEKHEGVHEFLVLLLREDLPQWMDNIDRETALKLLKAKSSAAKELGGIVLERHYPNWVAEFEIAEIVKLASHEILAVREAARKMFVQSQDRIRHNLPDKLAAVRLLEAKWQDSREFARHFFTTEFTAEDWTPEVTIIICDSIRDDVRQFGRSLVTQYFEQSYGQDYLLKFSEHPSTDMQLFATNYLERYAANNPERLRELTPYFISVLCQVNRGRVAKQRVFSFLDTEAQKSEAAAKIVAEILTRQSATIAIGDKAKAIQTMVKIRQRYPQILLPIEVKPVTAIATP